MAQGGVAPSCSVAMRTNCCGMGPAPRGSPSHPPEHGTSGVEVLVGRTPMPARDECELHGNPSRPAK